VSLADWCPAGLAYVFDGRVPCAHAPRLARFDKQAWLVFCANSCMGRGPVSGAGSLFRLRDSGGLVASLLPAPSKGIALARKAIESARPLVALDAESLIPAAAREVARILGADRWHVSFLAETPALVGFDRSVPVALVACTVEAEKVYGAELRAMVGP
jgi:hypothetical protein